MKPVWTKFEGDIGKDLIDAAVLRTTDRKPDPCTEVDPDFSGSVPRSCGWDLESGARNEFYLPYHLGNR
jgi:hypothetical protein